MDNREISIKSKGRSAFDLAFQLMFDNAAGGKATHYQEVHGKGFHVYNEAWGRIEGTSYGFLAVKPMWAWFGK